MQIKLLKEEEGEILDEEVEEEVFLNPRGLNNNATAIMQAASKQMQEVSSFGKRGSQRTIDQQCDDKGARNDSTEPNGNLIDVAETNRRDESSDDSHC